MKIIETERLILRTWKNFDLDAYYHINQDPMVTEFLGGPLSMQEIQDFMKAQNQQFDQMGYALWAVEEKSSGKLIGFIGLNQLETGFPFSPCVEIGWRLGSEYWKKGYATEGARVVLDYGFKNIKLKEIIAFTVPANIRSIRVMEKIGMVKDVEGNFAHPKLPGDHRLSQHVLYRITSSFLK